jgi:hypothetical protein
VWIRRSPVFDRHRESLPRPALAPGIWPNPYTGLRRQSQKSTSALSRSALLGLSSQSLDVRLHAR